MTVDALPFSWTCPAPGCGTVHRERFDPTGGALICPACAAEVHFPARLKETPMTDARTEAALEGRKMTPEEWRDFYLARTPEQQLTIAEQVLDNSDMSNHCFLANHDGAVAEVHRLSALLDGMLLIHAGVAAELERAADVLDECAGHHADHSAFTAELRERASQFRAAAGEDGA